MINEKFFELAKLDSIDFARAIIGVNFESKENSLKKIFVFKSRKNWIVFFEVLK